MSGVDLTPMQAQRVAYLAQERGGTAAIRLIESGSVLVHVSSKAGDWVEVVEPQPTYLLAFDFPEERPADGC